MSANPGGSKLLTASPAFRSVSQLEDYLKAFDGYDYTNNLSFSDRIENKRVAELGCGNGNLTVVLAQFASSIDGFDVDVTALERAATLAPLISKANVHFYPIHGYRTGASPESYDVVLSADVLEHVTDPASYLKECNRILRPGGLLLLTTPNGLVSQKDPRIIREHSPFHITEYYPEELRTLITTSGFRLQEVFRKSDTKSGGYRRKRSPAERLRHRIIWTLRSVSDRLGLWFSPLVRYSPGIERYLRRPDLASDYEVTRSRLEEISESNCDVIMIIADKPDPPTRFQ